MLEQVRIVLINTTHPGNIGAVARAMKNMGLAQLYLVEPKMFPHEHATARASGATDILEGAVVVSTLEEALEGCQLVLGASARSRHIPWPVMNPRKAAEQISALPGGGAVAILFGREDRGLTNEELHRCHQHIHIPANEQFSSLNVGAAVQVICYELRMAWLNQQSSDPEVGAWGVEWDIELATSDELERMFEHLEQALIDIEFLDPGNPRQLMTRLRRLYMRAQMDKVEVNVMRGMLTAMQKRLKQSG